jgi:glucosamine--fructose-6-phosphate aminotransferase (isomerizing)
MMAREMAEQPQVLQRLLARCSEVHAMVREIVLARPAGIVLLARGTSDNAAVFGRYLLEATLGVPVGLAAPSLWTRYDRHADLRGQLLIAVSQSGETPEIERIVRLVQAAGASTIAITNDADSPVATAADGSIALHAGVEQAVPATKTFTAQLVALALLAGALTRRDIPALKDLKLIPALQNELLSDVEGVRSIAASRLVGARAAVVVGSGFLYAIALEAALKLLETTSLPVLPYSASDLVHGPIAVAAPDVPVICFAAPGPVRRDVEAAAVAARDRGAPVIWISERLMDTDAVDEHLAIPGTVAEPVVALLHAVRAQQLALEASRAFGVDPDAPRGLQKITPTR